MESSVINIFRKLPVVLFLLLVTANCYPEPLAGKNLKTIRIMTVVICQQGDFLQYLFEPYLAKKNISIDYSQGHHNEVVAAIKRGQVDIAITHTKVKAMQELVASGLLVNGRTVFANPKAFLGPDGDPADIAGLDDAAAAMQRIQEQGYCYVINPHGNMTRLQRNLLEGAQSGRQCVIDNVQNTWEALQMANDKGAYTMWGLHPYLAKGKGSLQPVVIPDQRLLQNLGAWVVQGSDVMAEARDLVEYLASDVARARIVKYRFPDHDTIQPWWPPKRGDRAR